MKPLQKLLKKDAKLEWTNEDREAFRCIKEAITKSPVLVSPDYSKDFMIFSFASEDTIAGDLPRKTMKDLSNPSLS